MIDRSGITKLSNQINDRCTIFVKSIQPNNTASSRKIASETLYDCKILKNMITENKHPQWLIRLIEKCELIQTAEGKEYLSIVAEFVDIMYEAKQFNWDSAFGDSDNTLNFDKLFDEYKAQSKLDEALEKLIKCLEIILNEPTFNLNRKTREDIKTVINGIRVNKNSSNSAIRSALASLWGLIKTIVPYVDTYEKWCEFSGKLHEAYIDTLNELEDIRIRIQDTVKKEFLNDNISLPDPEELNADVPLLAEPEKKDNLE